jgi:choline-sulfatase
MTSTNMKRRVRRAVPVVVAVAALVMLVSAAGGSRLTASPAAARPNVLLVTIDTLRADRLGSYGYRLAHTPVLDKLAAESVRFDDATAHVPLTLPAHVSIMTGRYPGEFGIRLNGMNPLSPSVPTLASRFKEAGYTTAAVVASAILDKTYGLARGFDLYDDAVTGAWGASMALSEMQRPAGEVMKVVGRWLDSAPRTPWFLWVHLFDPHRPYEPPAKYLALAGGRPYDGEVAYADSALGPLVARLDRASTVLVVTGDHGESLGEHGEEDHGYYIYDATLRVPLIIAAPGVPPRVVREQVRSIDIAPTIEALAGLAGAVPRDGESLVPLMRGETRRDVPPSYAESWYPRLHFGWSELRGIRVGEWKYIAAPRPELYDLRTDAVEKVNVVQQKAPVAGRLASDLATIGGRADVAAGQAAKAAPQPDPETVRRLQALGYVGSFAPASSTAATADPKDRIGEYEKYRALFNRALGLLTRTPAESVPIFKELLKTNVRAFEAHLYLGNAYAALGKYDAALGEYDAARLLNPDLTQVSFEAAKALSAKGDVAAAVARAKEGLQREPLSFYGHYTLGVIHEKAGQLNEAAAEFTRAVELNGRDPRARGNLAQVAMQTGAFEVARVQCEKMIELGYRVAPAHYNLGILAERAGQVAEAKRRYTLALEADPAFAPARERLTRLGKQ